MSWLHQILGKASGNVAEVDANSQLLVALNQDPSKVGGVRMYDSEGNAINVEENGSLSVSQDELTLSEQVDGTTLNTNKWTTSTSGMTIAQSAGFISLNSGLATTAGAYAILNSILNVPLYGDMPCEFSFNAKINIAPQSNVTSELGFGTASGVSAPTDGAFFRWTSTGQLQAVVNNNGSETTQVCALPAGSSVLLGALNDSQLYVIDIAEDHVRFAIDDVIVANIQNPPALAFPVNAGHQPVFARVYNGGSSPSQPAMLSIGQVMVRQIAVQTYKAWRDRIVSFGMGAYQSPVTPFGQTANHANSSGPSSATLANTAAGYTTLGGKWQFAAVGGAVTDFALFAFQVPSPFKLYVTSIHITAMVTGIPVVTATMLDWALGVNASAVSLATADSPPTSWAPRRIPLGSQGFAALAALAAPAADIVRVFDPPLIVDSNRFLHVILQVPLGAATASLILRGNAFINGYFE